MASIVLPHHEHRTPDHLADLFTALTDVIATLPADIQNAIADAYRLHPLYRKHDPDEHARACAAEALWQR
jgi:hypothetical protein